MASFRDLQLDWSMLSLEENWTNAGRLFLQELN